MSTNDKALPQAVLSKEYESKAMAQELLAPTYKLFSLEHSHFLEYSTNRTLDERSHTPSINSHIY
jgi:hypothetical protein